MQNLITILEVFAAVVAIYAMIKIIYNYFKKDSKYLKQKVKVKLIQGKVVEKRKLKALAGGFPPFVYYLVVKNEDKRYEIYVSENDYKEINLGDYIKETSYGKIEKIEKRE